MAGELSGPRQMTLPEAAGVLHLPVSSVEALVGAGYLRPSAEQDDGPRFAMGDLKAFLARNVDHGGSGELDAPLSLGDLDFGDFDPDSLFTALDSRAGTMARRALDLFVSFFPEAASWGPSQQARFIEDAKARFEAILAVASLGDDVDETLMAELASVGAEAAESGAPLPEILAVLRISRDLVVQTAVEVAEERGRHWGLALSLVLTRVLPALDRLTDAVARGHWQAVMNAREEGRARYANVVERSTDGVYEVDLAGRIRYANASLAVIVGRRLDELVGARLVDVLDPATQLNLDDDDHQSEVAIRRADGVVRIVDIHTVERRVDGEVVGHDGVVRDLTSMLRFEQLRNEFFAFLGHELRQPLTTVLGLGATLEAYGDELDTMRVKAVGEKIRQQAERMTRLADDLHQMSRLEHDSVVVTRRDVDLASAVHSALAAVPDSNGVEIEVPTGLQVIGDRRRLEQVIANLVENALVFGAAPVRVSATVSDGEVEIAVRDHGAGVDVELEPTLFSELRPLTSRPRRRVEGGIGLALVRGLVEAMGGRVWYEQADDGGACFVFTLPSA
jgi:PAS domain S-box-containing protein